MIRNPIRKRFCEIFERGYEKVGLHHRSKCFVRANKLFSFEEIPIGMQSTRNRTSARESDFGDGKVGRGGWGWGGRKWENSGRDRKKMVSSAMSGLALES